MTQPKQEATLEATSILLSETLFQVTIKLLVRYYELSGKVLP